VHFRVADVEKISRYLCPDPPPPADDFWAKGARGMFTTLAFYFYDLGQEPTLGNILRLAETPEGLQPFAKQVVKDAQAGKLKLSDATLRGFAKIAQRPEKTHGGMLDQLTNALAPLRNPIVNFATSANSFDLRKLREQPMSIYLTVLRPDLPALAPLISLFFQQLVDLTMTVEFGHDPAHRHEVLLGTKCCSGWMK
jgi:type IV secretion system protein VirD4